MTDNMLQFHDTLYLSIPAVIMLHKLRVALGVCMGLLVFRVLIQEGEARVTARFIHLLKKSIRSLKRLLSMVLCNGKRASSRALSIFLSTSKSCSQALKSTIHRFTVLCPIPNVLAILRLLKPSESRLIICVKSMGSSLFAISQFKSRDNCLYLDLLKWHCLNRNHQHR